MSMLLSLPFTTEKSIFSSFIVVEYVEPGDMPYNDKA
jgi:hypothetical protein